MPPDALLLGLPLGPLELTRLPAAGLVTALAYVLGLALSVQAGRRSEVSTIALVETYVAAVPVALVGRQLPALVGAWSDVLASPSALVHVAVAPGSDLSMLAALGILLALMTWAQRRSGLQFLDAMAAGGALALVVALTAFAMEGGGPGAREAGLAAALGLVASVATLLVARRGGTPGEAALLGIESVAVALVVRHARALPDSLPLGPFAARVGILCSVAVALVALHLSLLRTLRRRGESLPAGS